MFKSRFTLVAPRFAIVGLFSFLLLLLSACGGTRLTYEVTGSVTEAEVAYRDQYGDLQIKTVSLPWRENLRIKDGFRFEVNADKGGSAGDITCTVTIDGQELGTVTGVSFAECRGRLVGGEASFQGQFDRSAE